MYCHVPQIAMLKKLHLKNFKGFKDAGLNLGNFSLLVGTNASGKSNIRDAFRFLHGIGRGYSLADIFGEKYIEGGVLQWRGIRGGLREAVFKGEKRFSLEVTGTAFVKEEERDFDYFIGLDISNSFAPPELYCEQLILDDSSGYSIEVEEDEPFVYSSGLDLDSIRFDKPILVQVAQYDSIKDLKSAKLSQVSSILRGFSNMRFMDLDPDELRKPSYPGQTVLGDRGENLSSVLQAICNNPQKKQALLGWVQELTPMDAVDFEFVPDQIGRILLTLVESNGQKISAYSASDGTLRFLAMIAALLGDEPAQFYFLEEIDNGIHPTRLHMLVQLIEQVTKEKNIQMVATTHSPQLLQLLSPESLENASLTYRLPDRPDAQIKRILDIPDAKRLIDKKGAARLHESGWLETAVYFTADDPESEAVVN
jgi:predicted ATPase